MFLQKISLAHFKSYEYESFEFSERGNCIVGENGTGKTNLLDAIYFLALTKSSISNQDALSINHEAEYMMIEGEFNIKISTLFLLGTGTTETTILSIKLKDREGNWSNEIKTPVITIHQ